MRLARLLPAAVLALAACDNAATTAPRANVATGPSRSAASSPVYRDQYINRQVSFTFVNNCNGEVLTGTGNEVVVVTEVDNPAGGYHYAIRDQYNNLKLTGSFGSSYVGTWPYVYMDNSNPGGTYTFSEPQTINLIGKGQTPNSTVHYTYHYTSTPDGNSTSYVDNERFDCH